MRWLEYSIGRGGAGMNHGGALRVRALQAGRILAPVPSQVVLRCAQVLAVADVCAQLLAVAVVATTGGTIVGIFSRAVRRRRHETRRGAACACAASLHHVSSHVVLRCA